MALAVGSATTHRGRVKERCGSMAWTRAVGYIKSVLPCLCLIT